MEPKVTALSKIAKQYIDKNENKIKSTLTRLILRSPNFLQHKHDKSKIRAFLELDLKIKATSSITEVFQSEQATKPKKLNRKIEVKGADIVAYYEPVKRMLSKNGIIVLLKPFDNSKYYHHGRYKTNLTDLGKAVLVHEYVHHLLNDKKIILGILKLINQKLYFRHNNNYSWLMINEGFADLTAQTMFSNYKIAYVNEVNLVKKEILSK